MLRRRAVPLVLGLAALAGCSGSGEAAPTLPPVRPTTAAPSVTPAPEPGPTLPPEALANTPTGAEAFARYYIDVLNEAARTFDPGPLQAISDPRCMTCRAYIQSFEDSAAGAERYEGGHLTVRSVSGATLAEGTQQVLLDYDAEPLKVFDSNGALTVTNPAETNSTLVIELRRQGDSWVVLEAARA